MSKSNEIYKCCICGAHFVGWGNDPYPVVDDDDSRCCDTCNSVFIIPARLNAMTNRDADKASK